MRRRGLFGARILPNGEIGVGLTGFRLGHREFRQAALASRERVVWTFPEVDPDIIWRRPHDADGKAAAGIVQSCEKDPNAPAVREVWRIFQAYRDNILKALYDHEKRHNLGKMPEVAIVRPAPPRFAVQHVAQCAFANYFYTSVVDATEEDPLINAPVGKDSPS